jgi:hypothetical protein
LFVVVLNNRVPVADEYRHGRHSEQRPIALLALTQSLLGPGALDEVGGLSGQHVQQRQFALCGFMRLPPVI